MPCTHGPRRLYTAPALALAVACRQHSWMRFWARGYPPARCTCGALRGAVDTLCLQSGIWSMPGCLESWVTCIARCACGALCGMTRCAVPIGSMQSSGFSSDRFKFCGVCAPSASLDALSPSFKGVPDAGAALHALSAGTPPKLPVVADHFATPKGKGGFPAGAEARHEKAARMPASHPNGRHQRKRRRALRAQVGRPCLPEPPVSEGSNQWMRRRQESAADQIETSPNPQPLSWHSRQL